MQEPRPGLSKEVERQRGAGMLEALMAIGLLAIGTVVVIQSNSSLLKANRFLDIEAERIAMKKILLNQTECRKMPACVNNTLLNLTDFNDAILVSSSGQTKFGPWTVEARCKASGKMEVRAALLNSQGQTVKNPLTGIEVGLSDPASILIEEGVLCGLLNASAPAGADLTIVAGGVCTPAQGSCPPPAPGAPAKMCCEDGSDMPKPQCVGNKKEFYAYWDRQDDWGASGHWVVLCQ